MLHVEQLPGMGKVRLKHRQVTSTHMTSGGHSHLANLHKPSQAASEAAECPPFSPHMAPESVVARFDQPRLSNLFLKSFLGHVRGLDLLHGHLDPFIEGVPGCTLSHFRHDAGLSSDATATKLPVYTFLFAVLATSGQFTHVCGSFANSGNTTFPDLLSFAGI